MSNPNDIKVSINQTVTGTGRVAIIAVADEQKVRFVITNAASNNTIVIKGRITGQDDWDTLATIVGNAKQLVSVKTYDQMEVECTTYGSATTYVKVVASSFNDADGSTSIGAPIGGTIEDAEVISFTSSDSSVIIEADTVNNTIDFRAVGTGAAIKYTKTVTLVDWIGPSAGEYTLTIPFVLHAIPNPSVTCYETNGLVFDQLIVPLNIDSSNNIIITCSETPDTRFIGKIFIE